MTDVADAAPTPGEPGLRRDLHRVLRAGLAAADPAPILARGLGGSARAGWTLGGAPLLPAAHTPEEGVFVFGAGKAAAALGRAIAGGLEGERLSGRIIVKRGHVEEVRGVTVEEAAHPVPDTASVAATRRLVEDLRRVPAGSRVLFLLTGGASALLVAPASGIRFEAKARTNELLLASGADIHEINTVRKHLSAVKGGHLMPLVRDLRAAVLVISDVVGDDLTSIGSGPLTPDPTTFGDALEVLSRYDLVRRVPESVRRRLDAGAAGRIPETPSDARSAPPHHILASNRRSLDAAAAEAARLGYPVEFFGRDLTGEVGGTARAFATRLAEVAARPGPAALLAGGELTLRVTGDGQGGRSQEFALVAARALDGTSGVALLAGGTDGTDGPTDAAGAVVDGGSWARASELGLEPAAALARNDSWTVFDRTGELLRTGPTGTNVMDLMIGLTPGVRGDGSRSYHPHRKHRSDAGMTEFRKTSGT